ncbi:alkaline phosphatase [Malassezia sp. CBS 17886]|nr:alkaline phosphatase [Malassezia sp. CBS 17886]
MESDAAQCDDPMQSEVVKAAVAALTALTSEGEAPGDTPALDAADTPLRVVGDGGDVVEIASIDVDAGAPDKGHRGGRGNRGDHGDPAPPRWLSRVLAVQVFAGALFRMFVYVFLRVIPASVGFYALYMYAVYLAAWLVHSAYLPTSAPRAQTSGRTGGWCTATALLCGASTKNRRFNLVQLGVQTLLLLFFLDSYYSPYLFPSHREEHLRFARIGALSPTEATLHVRYPHPLPLLDGLWESDIDGVDSLQDAAALSDTPVRVVWRRLAEHDDALRAPASGAAVRDQRRWERGPLLRLAETSDWTATAKLQDLWPATRYEWRLAFVHNNTFAPLPDRAVQFITWPDPRLSAYLKSRGRAALNASEDAAVPYDDPNHFSFASTSCVKPDFPYNPAQFWAWNWLLKLVGIGSGPGGFAQRNRIRGFDLFWERNIRGRALPRLRFLLELGDLIYADVPRYGGPYLHAYRKLYRNVFASQSFRRVFSAIPVMGIYDDHEVVNNWSGGGYGEDGHVDDRVARAYAAHPSPPAGLRPGLQAWTEYVGDANPAPYAPGEHYYSFRYGDAAFFVLDTRAHRMHPMHPHDDRTTLGVAQRAALFAWLASMNHTVTFKFVVSSVPFTSLWGGPLDVDGRIDGWSAYPEERRMVLDVLEHVPNVVILSGDRHEFASVNLRNSVVEFSTSPLSMFCMFLVYSIDPPGAEELLKYVQKGNHKWSEFEVDTRDPHDPLLHVSLQVDGSEAWKLTVHGTPVHRAQSALGSLAKNILELLGFKDRRWF